MNPFFLKPGEKCSVVYTFIPPSKEERTLYPFMKRSSNIHNLAKFFCTQKPEGIIDSVIGGTYSVSSMLEPIVITTEKKNLEIKLKCDIVPYLAVRIRGDAELTANAESSKYFGKEETTFFLYDIKNKNIKVNIR